MRALLAAVVVATLAALGESPAAFQINWNARTPWNDLRPSIARGDWEAQQKEPFQIFDNVYYVGLQQYSAFLITTSDGLVLLDATYAETADVVLDNIRALGFDPADIRYTFISHGHGDHYAGARRVKEVAGGLGLAFGPQWTSLYVDSLARMRALESDVILPNHPYMSTGHVFALAEELERRPDTSRHPFASREKVDAWFDALEAVAREKLESER